MYAVIFKARIKSLDAHYQQTAARMRELAMSKYGCIDFISVCEDAQEVAISYWHSQADIARWKQDPEHLQAQARGRSTWYHSYHVEVVEIKRHYSHGI